MKTLNSLLPQVEQNLTQYLSNSEIPARLAEALRYVVLGGGKRLRPLLMIIAAVN